MYNVIIDPKIWARKLSLAQADINKNIKYYGISNIDQAIKLINIWYFNIIDHLKIVLNVCFSLSKGSIILYNIVLFCTILLPSLLPMKNKRSIQPPDDQ